MKFKILLITLLCVIIYFQYSAWKDRQIVKQKQQGIQQQEQAVLQQMQRVMGVSSSDVSNFHLSPEMKNSMELPPIFKKFGEQMQKDF